MKKSHRLHVTLSAQLFDMLQAETESSGLNMAEIVRAALWRAFKEKETAAQVNFINQQLEAAKIEDGENE